MSYPHSQLETRQSIFVDVYDTAHAIQSLLAPVLLPPTAGLYLPDQLEPVMELGKPYWYEKTVFVDTVVENKATIHQALMGPDSPKYFTGPIFEIKTTPWQYYHHEYIPVTSFQEVALSPWDVVSTNPEYDARPKQVVLPHHLAKDVNLQPTLPVMGLKIAQQFLANEIEISRAYTKCKNRQHVEYLILPYVQDIYKSAEHMRNDLWFIETLNVVFDTLLDLAKTIATHLSGNPFQVCAVTHQNGYQFRIDQLGDYRVMEWERLQNDPEFHRWQQTRAASAWDQLENNAATPYLATSHPYR